MQEQFMTLLFVLLKQKKKAPLKDIIIYFRWFILTFLNCSLSGVDTDFFK